MREREKGRSGTHRVGAKDQIDGFTIADTLDHVLDYDLIENSSKGQGGERFASLFRVVQRNAGVADLEGSHGEGNVVGDWKGCFGAALIWGRGGTD